jgi:hypothetical protein
VMAFLCSRTVFLQVHFAASQKRMLPLSRPMQARLGLIFLMQLMMPSLSFDSLSSSPVTGLTLLSSWS